MSEAALENAQAMAAEVTSALGGWGLFGVELFIKDGKVTTPGKSRPGTGMMNGSEPVAISSLS